MKSNKQTFQDTKQLTTHFLKHTTHIFLLLCFIFTIPTLGFGQNVLRTRTIEQTNHCTRDEPYSFYMSDANSEFEKRYQIQNGEFIEYDNGTARITGLAVNNVDSNIKWRIDVNLSDRIFTVDPDSVKAPGCLPLDVSDWYLYTETTGTFIGEGSMQGAVANMYRRGPAFQLGTAANETEKNSRFNGCGWHHIEFTSQPNNGMILENTVGDLNLNLTGSPITEQENCTGEIAYFKITNDATSITLQDGGSYSIGDLPANSTIEAVATGSHESIGFNVNGAENEENTVPYDHYWTPAVGTYTISASLFNEDNCSGIKCDEKTITITITNNILPPTNVCVKYKVSDSTPECGAFPNEAGVFFRRTCPSPTFEVWKAGDDLILQERGDGTAALTGSVYNGTTIGIVNIEYSGYSSTGTHWNNECYQNQMTEDYFYNHFEGSITIEGVEYSLIEKGASHIFGPGANNESTGEFGFGGWLDGTWGNCVESFGKLTQILPGSTCDDGNDDTVTDVIQADGCTCAGTIIEENVCVQRSAQLYDRCGDEGLINRWGLGLVDIDWRFPVDYMTLLEYTDGTAKLIGHCTNKLDSGIQFDVEINFTGRTFTAPADGAYPGCVTTDESSFYYYEDFTGTFTGTNDMEGAVIAVSEFGGNFQLGFGANHIANTTDFGGSSWFQGEVVSQPNNTAYNLEITVGEHLGDIHFISGGDIPSCLNGPCTSLGGDADNDGVCAEEDCDDNNANLPATPGTACNDNNSNTITDVIQADGCTCEGIDATATIGNFVWADTNNNGVQDSGEPGISGVVVMLLDGNGNMVSQTTTDQNGQYIFDGLTAGTYKVKFPTSTNTNGSDYILTTPNNGDETKDSDAQPMPGTNDAMTEIITLNVGDNYKDLDAGYILGCSNVNFDFSATSVSDVTCNNSNDGQIDLSLTGGTAPYSYNWSNGATTQDLTNLAPGNYLVTVTDNNGCEGTYSASISEPTTINASTNATNVACSGGDNGAVQISVDGGTAPYSYNWSNGATTQNINSLTAGDYSVTITDANNCSTTADASVDQAGDLLVTVDQATNVSCNGDNDGAISISVSGGTAPYSFNWSNGATTEDLTGLTAGDYTGNITDANGCSIAATVTITEPAVLSGLLNIDNITCSGNNTGQIELSVSGGSAPYTYNWSNGETTRNLTNQGAGVYSVIITDAKDCVTELSGEILETAELEIETQRVENVTCAGDADGLIDITIVGGTSPYSFNWSNGANSEDISNLSAGNYQVTITDANGCQGFYENVISEPAPLECKATILSNLTTRGGSDASLSASALGGSSPYSYLWNTQQTTAEISNLSAGTYQVTITDNNGCQCETIIEINNPAKVGDYVWEDLNGDGIQNNNEPGIPNVEVTLTGTDVNGDNVTLTTSTDTNGQYDFDGLLPGTYKISVETPTGFASTPANVGNDELDSDVQNGMTPEFTIEYGDEDLSFDAGFYNPVNIGNFVWFDADNNGIQDVNEVGVNGVIVSLFDLGPDETFGTGDDILVETQTTQSANGADGNYQFTGVAPGKYVVKFELTDLSDEYEFTATGTSGDNVDSNADPVTGLTETIMVMSGQADDNSIDAGLVLACDVTAAFTTQQQFCEDELAQFTAEDSGIGATYEWVFFNGPSNASTFIGTRSGHDVPFRFTSPGDKFVKLVVTLPNGCQAFEERVISVGGNITNGGTIGSDEENCGAFDPTIITNLTSPTGGNGNFEFLWMRSYQSTPPTSIQDPAWEVIPNANGLDYDPGMIEETTYYIRCSRMEYCTNFIGESNVVSKSINGNLVSEFTTDDFICWKRPIEFIADLQESDATYQWLIFRGVDQTGTYLGAREGGSMEFNFSESGAHYVQLQVSLPNGCTGTYGEEIFVDGYSRICGDSIALMVVTALNFDAQPKDDGTVLLTWEISNEPANVQYTVEHSTGEDDFEAIGNVKGDFSENYEFVDDAPMFGINYYRLKYIYADGTIDFSDIKQVVMRFDDKQKVNVFPNPTQDITRLRLAEPDTEDISIELINGQGITLEKVMLPAGETDVEFDLTMYESGHYFIYMQKKGRKSLLSRVMKIND